MNMLITKLDVLWLPMDRDVLLLPVPKTIIGESWMCCGCQWTRCVVAACAEKFIKYGVGVMAPISSS
jgi:hypothetical protein